MNDVYVECLTEAKASATVRFFKGLLGFLAVFSVFAVFLVSPVFLLLAVIFGVGAYFVNMFADIEYEYLYVEKELTIDRIYGKSRRKKADEFQIDRMEILAPIHSYHLDNYKNRKVVVKDYSIGEELQPDLRYAMYYEGGVKVILSPSEEMVKAIKMVAPRKVFTE